MDKQWTAAVLLIGTMASSGYALAWGGLQSQNADGFSRYCKYTDGGVLTVGSTDLCPATNHAESSGGGSPTVDIQNRNGGFGALVRQILNGTNRYCLYTDKSVRTVAATQLCPSSSQ